MKDIFCKEGILFVVQIDHLSGEIMGSIFDMFYSVGALNVQCLQTITKKNRPGKIFIIDVQPDKADLVETIIINELDSTGWHKIITDHRHVPTQIVAKNIEVHVNLKIFKFKIFGKYIKNKPYTIRPEHSNCMELREKIKENMGIDIPLKIIYIKVQTALFEDEKVISFDL